MFFINFTSSPELIQPQFKMYNTVKNLSLDLGESLSSNPNLTQNNSLAENIPQYKYSMEHNQMIIWSKEIVRYVFPVIIFFGTVGNLLSILVLYRKAMQRNCSSTYLIMLAFMDTAILFLSCFKTWLMVVSDFELLHVSGGMCKTLKYLFFTCTHLSAWLIVLLTCERFLVVCFPFRAPRYWIVHRPRVITFITASIIMIINSNYFWTSELVMEYGKPQCVVFKQNTLMCEVFPILNMLVYSLIPAAIVFSFNIAIIVTIARHRYAKDAQLPRQTASPALWRQNQQRLTIMLLCISVLWLLLTSPYAISSSPIIKVSILVRTIAFLLMYTNHAINFYIYCLTGKKFRFELKRLFGYQVYGTSKNVQQLETVSPPRRDGTLKLSRRSYPMDQLYK